MRALALALGTAAFTAFTACAGAPDAGPASTSPFAVRVVSFTPGTGAGFGADKMPGVVLGPPLGGVSSSGSLDVVSLGTGGSIVLEMGEDIVDGDGVDLIVFENPFLTAGGVAADPEAGEVAVSLDGAAFTAFPCAKADPAPNGCAGFGAVTASDASTATDPALAGGDDFDLATIGVARARFVRIVDQGNAGPAPKAGFDLDAVAVAAH
ncbi:MAG TPA: cell surface protein [Myxococcota bacterium]|jgi:hypothetical protein